MNFVWMFIWFIVMCTRYVRLFSRNLPSTVSVSRVWFCVICCVAKRARPDNGCGAGVCHSEQYNRQTAVWSGMLMVYFTAVLQWHLVNCWNTHRN